MDAEFNLGLTKSKLLEADSKNKKHYRNLQGIRKVATGVFSYLNWSGMVACRYCSSIGFVFGPFQLSSGRFSQWPMKLDPHRMLKARILKLSFITLMKFK